MPHGACAARTWIRTGIIVTLAAAVTALGIQAAPPAGAATAAKIAPAAGPVGTGITIAGDGLANTTGVTFLGGAGAGDNVGVPAPYFIALDNKKVVVQVPPGAETGPIRVHTSGGNASTGPVVFTVYDPPTISSLSATQGVPGEEITVTGQNLLGVKAPTVTFGAKKAAPLAGATQTAFTVKVPAGLPGGATSFTVTTPGGSAERNFSIGPVVTGMTPLNGSTVGGTIATITGSGFTGVDNFTDDPDTTEVDESLDGVTVGGVRVTRLIPVSDKELVVEVPPGLDTAAPVVVSTLHGGTIASTTGSVRFAYQPVPAVTSATQNYNLVGEPDEIVYTGLNFNDGTVVKVGGLDPIAAVVDAAAGTITVTPAVSVKPLVTAATFTNTVDGVSYVATTPFAYVAAPTLAKMNPITGPAGTSVLISGTGFGSDTTVLFGQAQADCTVVTFVMLRCVAPPGTDIVDVTVVTEAGTSPPHASSKFSYTEGTAAAGTPAGAPTVAALTPPYGAAGTTLALKGANLGAVSQVEFTGPEDTWVEAADFMVVGPGRIVVKVPAGAVTGELQLTWPGGRVETYAKIYTQAARPSVASIDVVGDATYAATPGDMLTIKGTGLMIKGVKPVVTIGGKPAPVMAKPTPNAKTLVAKVPANVGGRAAVVVTTPLGSDTAGQHLYYGPEVKKHKPATFSRTGGVIVTVTGLGFTGASDVTVGAGRLSAVTFGRTPVARMVVMSDKSIVVSTAKGSRSADDLVVTTQHDTKFVNSDGRIKSVNAPIPGITGVNPPTGPTGSAPPPVTITGQNLLLTSVVRFGASTATVVSAAPDGSSMVVVPPVRNAPTTVPITVLNDDDGDELSVTESDAYTYELQAATVTGMSVTTAPAGTTITISGTSFVDVTSVKFGNVSATYTVANGNTIFATVPATPVGGAGTTVDVTVVNATGNPSTGNPATADDWTWDNSPTITALSVSTAAAGATVTISGSNLTGATRVRFGWTDATTFTVVDDSTITAVVPSTPAGMGGQTVDVVVQIGMSVSQVSSPAADDWTWMGPAVVTAMSHNTAPAGTTVTVTGTGFTGVSEVLIHSKPVTSFEVVSPTTLTFVVPPADPNGANSVGSKRDLRIFNGSGLVSTADPVTADDWTYQ